ncbi:hemerythrin [Silvimonas iriomotensis]|uniref:Hemerythrin n=2 Tax=Silvimonas iriomotensis TaxID=449662 RepID=A0ABQ2P817_9NEIS|nr:hemerythrin [Silvimonas iriomotensis]
MPVVSAFTSGAALTHDRATFLLRAEHATILQLFAEYERRKYTLSARQKAHLVRQTCRLLAWHSHVEEQLFYPAARTALHRQGHLIDEAAVEHATCNTLMAQLEVTPTDHPLYEARFKVLSEYVAMHFAEEEERLFPLIRALGTLDLNTLGDQMLSLQHALRDEALAGSAH